MLLSKPNTRWNVPGTNILTKHNNIFKNWFIQLYNSEKVIRETIAISIDKQLSETQNLRNTGESILKCGAE